jgi:hypothetical protein
MARIASAHFEPVAWWYTRQQIGRSLREYYGPGKDLPPRLGLLVRKLDDTSSPRLTLIANLFLAALIAAIVAASFRFHFVF